MTLLTTERTLSPQKLVELPEIAMESIFEFFGENPLLTKITITGERKGLVANKALQQEVIKVLSVFEKLFNGSVLDDSLLELPSRLFYKFLSLEDLAFLPPYKFRHCIEKLIENLVFKNRITEKENAFHKSQFGINRYKELARLLQDKNDKALQEYARLIDKQELNLTPPPSEEPSTIALWLKQVDVISELTEYISFDFRGLKFLPKEVSILSLDNADCDPYIASQLSDMFILHEQTLNYIFGLEQLATDLVKQIPQISIGDELDILEWLKDPTNKTKIEQVTTIDLSDCDLTVVPPEIGLFTNLTFLNLANNLIEYLPREIGSLTKLKKLELQNNKFTHFPSEIAPLKNLVTLNLQQNSISDIPVMVS
jgi:hypothetical protein